MSTKISLVNLTENCRYPKLGLGYLASYARQYSSKDLEIRIHDASVTKDVYKEVASYNPDIIGVSCLTIEHNLLRDFAAKNKEDLRKPLIAGGVHYTSLPNPEDYIDVAVVGEGEQTFLELAENYSNGRIENLNNIKGILFHDSDKKLKATGSRDFIKNLDEIPYPARDLFDMDFYSAPIKSDTGRTAKETHQMSSRGCPYVCGYCASSTFWERKSRFASPEYVVGEAEELIKKYKIDSVLFFDDLFTINKKRLDRISSMVKERGLDKEATFGCFSRSDTINEEIIGYLKKMNVISIVFGFETGSQKMLKYLKNDTTSVEENAKAIDLCKKHGIRVASGFMAGSPFETRQDLEDTANFIKKHNLDTGWVSLTLPFPNTKLWDYAVERGIIDPNNINWDIYNPMLHHKITEGDDIFKDKVVLTQEVDRKEFINLFMEIQKAIETKSYRYYEKDRERKK